MNLFLANLLLPTLSMVTQQVIGGLISQPTQTQVSLLTPLNALKISALAHPIAIWKGGKALVVGTIKGIATAVNGSDDTRQRISSSVSQHLNPFYDVNSHQIDLPPISELTDSITNQVHKGLVGNESVWYWRIAQVTSVILITCFVNNFLVKKQLTHLNPIQNNNNELPTIVDDSIIINNALAVIWKYIFEYLPFISAILSLSIGIYLIYKNKSEVITNIPKVNISKNTNNNLFNAKQINKKLLKLEQAQKMANQKLITDNKNTK